jgi:hypothetical protein
VLCLVLGEFLWGALFFEPIFLFILCCVTLLGADLCRGVGLVVMGRIGEFFGASKFVSDIICVFWPVLGDLCQCVVVVGGAVLRAFGVLFG